MILEDFNDEKLRLENTSTGATHIYLMISISKRRSEKTNIMLQSKSEELNRANEECRKHVILWSRESKSGPPSSNRYAGAGSLQ